MIKCVIFDFDGVIVESVDVKTEAFRELFRDYPQHLDEVIKYHLQNGGISRFDKFRFIYKNILKKDLSEEKFQELCEHFSKLVVDKVIASPFVQGAESLLKSCHGRYAMFIVSGTPEFEIRRIVKGMGLDLYFSGVFGSPKPKEELIRNILKTNHCQPDAVVFIGDSANDREACEQTGVRFIARLREGLDWIWGKQIPLGFKSMDGVYDYLEKIK